MTITVYGRESPGKTSQPVLKKQRNEDNKRKCVDQLSSAVAVKKLKSLKSKHQITLTTFSAVPKLQITKNYSDDNRYTHVFPCGKISFPMKAVGAGKHHCVYEFVELVETDTPNTIKLPEASDKTVKIVDCILKRLNVVNIGPHLKKQNKIIQDSIKGYEYLQKMKIKVPQVLLSPNQRVNPENRFWIIEKMHEAVSCDGWSQGQSFAQLNQKDQKVLNFIKEILTASAKQRKIIVDDLYPRNLMLNRKGEICVVDFSVPAEESGEFELGLFSCLVAWANGNENIWDFLINEFPETVKLKMGEKLTQKKGDVFPVKS